MCSGLGWVLNNALSSDASLGQDWPSVHDFLPFLRCFLPIEGQEPVKGSNDAWAFAAVICNLRWCVFLTRKQSLPWRQVVLVRISWSFGPNNYCNGSQSDTAILHWVVYPGWYIAINTSHPTERPQAEFMPGQHPLDDGLPPTNCMRSLSYPKNSLCI